MASHQEIQQTELIKSQEEDSIAETPAVPSDSVAVPQHSTVKVLKIGKYCRELLIEIQDLTYLCANEVALQSLQQNLQKALTSFRPQVPSENGIFMEVVQPKKKFKINSKQNQLAAVAQKAPKEYAKLPVRLKLRKKNKQSMATAMTSKSSNSKISVKTCGEPKHACNHGCVNHCVPIMDDKSNFDGNNGVTELPMTTWSHREISANFDTKGDQEHETSDGLGSLSMYPTTGKKNPHLQSTSPEVSISDKRGWPAPKEYLNPNIKHANAGMK